MFRWMQRFWLINPASCAMVVVSLIALVCSSIGLVTDHRYIAGELAWIKPFKFSLSLALYGGSLVFISQYLDARKFVLKATSYAALAGCIVELCAISFQSFRGEPSHFNLSTPIDAALWYIIKAAIMPVAFSIVAMLIMLLRQRTLPAVLGSAICWGALLAAVGFIPGFLMLLPEHLQHVFTNRVVVGHTVGISAHVSVIPYLGWSTIVGDLRVAHFVGLHALQIMPLLGAFINSCFSKLSLTRRYILVSISGFTYFAVIMLLTWQALRGESIFSPGHQTIYSFSTLFAIASSLFAIVMTPIKYADLWTEASRKFATAPVRLN